MKEIIKPENKYKKFIAIESFAISITGIEADISITGIDTVSYTHLTLPTTCSV